MEMTDEQRRRAEANRLAALRRLHRPQSQDQPEPTPAAGSHKPWTLFRCRKFPEPDKPPQAQPARPAQSAPAERFMAVLEICAPDSFSVTPEPVPDHPFPGKLECLKRIEDRISPAVPFRLVESQVSGRSCVYSLNDYDLVLNCLKKIDGMIQLQPVPWRTLAVIRKFVHCHASGCWVACMPNHLSDEEVDGAIGALPDRLRGSLLPFQLEGVRFGLRRGGRCLIADEMGLGKTVQAIAIACCFMGEGPVLIVCPAVLRFTWAEEIERWLPSILPTEIHLVFGHRDNPAHLAKLPKVVVISYTMLNRLRRHMLELEWALVIVDEAHCVRCTKKASEADETQAVLDVASRAKRIVLLTGTPSLSRPFDIYHQINMLWSGLLGKDKYEFADSYCSVKLARGSQGKIFKDFSGGIRLEELSVLLKQTVMIRRLKEHVLVQLPPKRRQVIRVLLKAQDIRFATLTCQETDLNEDEEGSMDDFSDQDEDAGKRVKLTSARHHSLQEIGLAKLPGFREWLYNHSVIMETDGASSLDASISSQKMIIFAHHIKVLDRIQEYVSEKDIGFVRIDGSTLPRDRQAAVQAFKLSSEVMIAIIGITAGGVGLDFSSARNVVFVELPKSASEMLQAEDRAHRRGQANAVNVYIFCAKNTSDETHWQHLNRSLYRVSSMMNGKQNAMRGIEVDEVCNLSQFIHLKTKSRTEGGYCSSKNGEQLPPVSIPLSVDVSEPSNDENGTSTETVYDSSPSSHSQSETQFVGSKAVTSEANLAFEGSSEIQKMIKDNGVLPDSEQTNSEDVALNSSAKADDRINESVETDANNAIRADSLRFEVSQYTGRIHMYACVSGIDTRPRPLFQNFHPEELESADLDSLEQSGNTIMEFIREIISCKDLLLTFFKEWNILRPIERNKLYGKPLQLPLELELCYLKESINHGTGGLLKGGSKRRVTPLCDIGHLPPENASWKKISLRNASKRKEREYLQAWSITGEPLCKLCQTACSGRQAKEPEFFEDLFCTLSCFQEYRIRTSQRSLRDALFQIEHGVCTSCKLDCHKLVGYLKPLSVAKRKEHIEKAAPKLASNKNLLEKLIHEPTAGNAWHADHIVPVYKGGGECKLENMRTLCVACHYEVTADQRVERRLLKKQAKERLQTLLNEIKGSSDVGQVQKSASNSQGQHTSELLQNSSDADLVIRVPGSSYSEGATGVLEMQQK